MSDNRLGFTISARDLGAKEEIAALERQIKSLQATVRSASQMGLTPGNNADIRRTAEEVTGLERRLEDLNRAAQSNSMPAWYSRLARASTEAEQAVQKFKSTIAPQSSIRAHTQELQAAARATEQLTSEQNKFANTVAPQMNIAAFRKEQADKIREATAAINQYFSAQEKANAQAQRFASTVAPQSSVRNHAQEIQAEAAATAKLTAEQQKFANVISPQVNVRQHAREDEERTRKAQAALARYVQEQERAAQGAQKFASSIATAVGDATPIKFIKTSEGLKAVAADAVQGGRNIGGATTALRTFITELGELERHQRGQLISTIGASLNRGLASGGGISAGTVATLGGAAVLGGGAAIVHVADQMANLNEQIKASAQVTGMSVREYAQLQGALTLTGTKAESADASLRHFASSIEKAMANATSTQAKALHALGITQDEINKNGQNTYTMLQRVAEASNKFADSSTKAAAWTEIFGRGDAALAHFLTDFQRLTTESSRWADAVDKNNEQFNKMGEQIHQLALNWETLKEEAAAPLNFIINLSIKGLEVLKEIPDDFARLGKYIYDFARPVRDLLGTTSPFEGAPAVPDTTLDDLHITAKVADARPKVPAFSTPKDTNTEAHKDFAAFATEERNKLRDVNLTLEQQQAILTEWAAGAQAAFAKGTLSAAGLRLELAKINTVALEIQKMDFSRAFEKMKSDLTDSNRELREFELNMETMVKRKLISPQQGLGFDIQRQAQVQQAGQAQIQVMYGEPGADIGKINQAWNTFEAEQNSAAAALQEKYAAADATLAKQFEKVFAGTFEKIGSGLERYLTEALTRSTTAGKAGRQLFQSFVAGGVGIVGDTAGQIGARLLGGAAGDGLAKTLSSKLFDFVSNQLAQITLLSGILGATTQTAVAADVSAVKPEVAGFSFAMGGIVPSAAGGMVVGGGGRGQIAILHPKEMVLPANISNHILSSMGNGAGGGGNTNLHYAPSIAGNGGFRSQSSAESFFRKHGNQMEQMARAAGRNRWRA